MQLNLKRVGSDYIRSLGWKPESMADAVFLLEYPNCFDYLV